MRFYKVYYCDAAMIDSHDAFAVRPFCSFAFLYYSIFRADYARSCIMTEE